MLLTWVVCTFAASIILTLAMERLARKFGVLSLHSFRRKIEERTPLLGGLAVMASASAGLFYFSPQIATHLFIAFLPLLVLGICDDKWEVSGRWKLTAQVLSAAIWTVLVTKDQLIFQSIFPYPFLGLLLSMAWIIGLTNAYNLIDGVDGQAASIGIIHWIALSLFMPDSQFGWVMAAAFGGFLVRNFHPAQVYLGETGSSFLGFSLAAVSTILPVTNPHFGHFMGLVFLFSLPLYDTVSAIWRRLRNGNSVFAGDREHIHHRLTKLQFSTVQTVFIMGELAFAGAATFVLAFKIGNPEFQFGIFLTSGSLLLLCYFGIQYCERHFSQRVLGLGRGILGRHLKSPPESGLFLAPTRSVIIDLLPYFREMQSQGIITLHGFLKDFSAVIDDLAREGKVKFFGSYSVALLFNGDREWTQEEQLAMAERFTNLFRDYHCRRGTSAIPEGVTFCDFDQTQKMIPVLEATDDSSLRTAA